MSGFHSSADFPSGNSAEARTRRGTMVFKQLAGLEGVGPPPGVPTPCTSRYSTANRDGLPPYNVKRISTHSSAEELSGRGSSEPPPDADALSPRDQMLNEKLAQLEAQLGRARKREPERRASLLVPDVVRPSKSDERSKRGKVDEDSRGLAQEGLKAIRKLNALNEKRGHLLEAAKHGHGHGHGHGHKTADLEVEMERARRGLCHLSDWFTSQTEDVQEALLHRFQYEAYRANQPIVREGEPADKFFVLLAGRVEVRRAVDPSSNHRSNAKFEVLAVLTAGNNFGENGILTGARRNATVWGTENAECLTLSDHHFVELMRSNSNFHGSLANGNVSWWKQNVNMMRHISEADLREFMRSTSLHRFLPGRVIDLDKYGMVCFLKEGRCTLFAAGEPGTRGAFGADGEQRVLTALSKGDFFGESAVFPHLQYGLFARTETNIECYVTTKQHLGGHPRIFASLRAEAEFRINYYLGRYGLPSLDARKGAKAEGGKKSPPSTLAEPLPLNLAAIKTKPLVDELSPLPSKEHILSGKERRGQLAQMLPGATSSPRAVGDAQLTPNGVVGASPRRLSKLQAPARTNVNVIEKLQALSKEAGGMESLDILLSGSGGRSSSDADMERVSEDPSAEQSSSSQSPSPQGRLGPLAYARSPRTSTSTLSAPAASPRHSRLSASPGGPAAAPSPRQSKLTALHEPGSMPGKAGLLNGAPMAREAMETARAKALLTQGPVGVFNIRAKLAAAAGGNIRRTTFSRPSAGATTARF